MDSILVIDIGTSSVRAVVKGIDGAVLASAALQRSAGICIDAEREWNQICKIAASANAGRYHIVSIAISALLGWVGVDRSGNALTPCYTYMHKENRTYEDMEERLPAGQIYQICRRKAAAEQLAYKMRRLSTEKQELYSEIHCFLSLKDFINRKLTGVSATDHTTASYTLLYDVKQKRWSDVCLDRFCLERDKLPQIRRSDEILSTVRDDLCSKLGLAKSCTVAVGSVDGSTGVFGAGGTKKGTLVSIMGTTETCFAIEGFLPEDETGSLVVNPHVIPGYYLAGGPTGLSGGTLDWYTKKILCGTYTLAEMNEKAKQVACGSDGVIMLPALEGDRAPFWKEQICGTVLGLKSRHGSEHIFRAAMEANGYTHRRLAELIRETGADLDRVIVTGGGASSDLWLQIKADILKMNVFRSAVREATTEGSWMLAMMSLGYGSEVMDGMDTARGFEMQKDQAEKYDLLYSNFLKIYDAASKLYSDFPFR